MKIRVLIVDDHPVVRHGLKSMLRNTSDIEVVGEAGDSEEAMAAVGQLSPDVVILDIRLPGQSGLAAVQSLYSAHPNSRVIVLTSYDDDEYLFGALRAGAHAFLLKSVAHEKLAEAIRTVHAGERMLSQDLMGRVLEEFEAQAHQIAEQEFSLIRSEVQILHLIAEGHTSKEIAHELHWSEVTVKRKISSILTKLDVRTRAQAVAEAARRGII